MPATGHGISEAVRNHIPIWVDEEIVEVLYSEYTKTGGNLPKENFKRKVRSSDFWKRKSRKKSGSGHERLYACDTVSKATLIVHSPATDMSANSYVFCIDSKPVAGGRTKLQSVHISQSLSKKDKTVTKPIDIQFVKLSESELRAMRTQMEFGDGFAQLELERGD